MRLRHISFFEILETWNFNLGENLRFHLPTSKTLTFYTTNVLKYILFGPVDQWSTPVICSSISRSSNVECDKVFYICTEKRAFEILSLISIITLPLTVSARGCIDIRENWQTQAIEPIIKDEKGQVNRTAMHSMPESGSSNIWLSNV